MTHDEPAIHRRLATPVGFMNFDHVSVPRMSVPEASCDCHVHVFNPVQFPYVQNRTYTPGPAVVDALIAFEQRLGIDRVVLVQPSSYGTDNGCLLDSLARLGPTRARGVAVVDSATIKAKEVDALHAAGVRAIRINLEVKGEQDSARAGAALRRALDFVAHTGWAVQVYADTSVVLALSDEIAAAKTPIILDHFGGLKSSHGLEGPGLATLVQLVKGSNVFIKLSAPYRVSKQAPDYADVAACASALIAAAPDRILWASDWPHTGSSSSRGGDLSLVEPFRVENDGRTLDLLADWSPDENIRHQILVDNPAHLFSFEA